MSAGEMGNLGDFAVRVLMSFLRTGAGFEEFWNHVGPTVEQMVRLRLRRRLVRGRNGGDDEDAVDESMQQVRIKLFELPSKDSSLWFDPAKGRGGVDGLRAWLFGFCRTSVADYCRRWRNANRDRKVIPESCIEFNELSDGKSIVKDAVAKIVVDLSELMQIVNECVEAIPDEELRTIIRLNIWEQLSERRLARHLGVHVSKVHRRLAKAKKLLEKELHRHGIDETWLGSVA